jgi:hypothetical protein
MATTTLSVWAVSLGAFVTLHHDGIFRNGTGTAIDVDPRSEVFVADSVVRRLDGQHGIRRFGNTCSPARLAAVITLGMPEGKRPAYVMTLEEALEHPVFGRNVPTIEAIEEAWALTDGELIA